MNIPIMGKCQVCGQRDVNTNPPRVCAVCGKQMCRFCFVMDKAGNVRCEEHKHAFIPTKR